MSDENTICVKYAQGTPQPNTGIRIKKAAFLDRMLAAGSQSHWA